VSDEIQQRADVNRLVYSLKIPKKITTCFSLSLMVVLAIRNEIDLIERGTLDKHNNPLKVSDIFEKCNM